MRVKAWCRRGCLGYAWRGRRGIPASRRGGDRLFLGDGGQHVLADASAAAFAPPQHHRRGDEDGGEGADDDADEDDEAEVTQGGATEKPRISHAHQRGGGGEQGPRQGGVDRLVHDLFHRVRADQQHLADAVEDDDGVTDRITGDGEHRTDVDEREFAAHHDDDADADDHVVENGDEAAQGERELEAHGHVEDDEDEADGDGDDRLGEERVADESGNLLLAGIDDVVFGIGLFRAERGDRFAQVVGDGVRVLGGAPDGEQGAGGGVAFGLRIGVLGQLGFERLQDLFHIRLGHLGILAHLKCHQLWDDVQF